MMLRSTSNAIRPCGLSFVLRSHRALGHTINYRGRQGMAPGTLHTVGARAIAYPQDTRPVLNRHSHSCLCAVSAMCQEWSV